MIRTLLARALSPAVAAGLLLALPIASFAADDPVVARVDGDPIHRSEVVAAQRQLPAQYQTLPFDTVFAPLVNQIIDRKLVAAKARAERLEDDAEYQAQLALLAERLLQHHYLVRKGEEAVTDSALEERYEMYRRDVTPEEQVRARHILVANQAEARRIIAELRGGGDFADLARRHSSDQGSASRGGDLGFFGREDMVAAFAEAAFDLREGQVTDTPVQTRFGWHVIRVEERRTAPVPSFEETREELAQAIRDDAMGEVMESVREGAEIEILSPDGGAPEIRPVP